MSQFNDLDEVLSDEPKVLPISGELVTFPARISAETGMILLRIQQRARENPALAHDFEKLGEGLLNEDKMGDVMADVLGRPIEEFLPVVGMNYAKVGHVFSTLMLWHLSGEDAAVEMWNNPGKAEAALAKATKKSSKAKVKSARPASPA